MTTPLTSQVLLVDGPLSLYVSPAPAVEVLAAYDRLRALLETTAAYFHINQTEPSSDLPPSR